MADQQPVIIIKKKSGGHAGAHGGAWKVAYADFVTAMMSFFLVLWLLGSDEEVKQAVESYFKNPAQPIRPDLLSDKAMPVGQATSAGSQLLPGAEGQVPQDQVMQPPIPQPKEHLEDGDEGLGKTATELLKDRFPALDINVEHLVFSIAEDLLFEGNSDEFSTQSQKRLQKLAQMVSNYRGRIIIQASTLPDPHLRDNLTDVYEFSLARAVAVMNYLIRNRLVERERISAAVDNDYRSPASISPGGARSTRRIQFIFTRPN